MGLVHLQQNHNCSYIGSLFSILLELFELDAYFKAPCFKLRFLERECFEPEALEFEGIGPSISPVDLMFEILVVSVPRNLVVLSEFSLKYSKASFAKRNVVS